MERELLVYPSLPVSQEVEKIFTKWTTTYFATTEQWHFNSKLKNYGIQKWRVRKKSNWNIGLTAYLFPIAGLDLNFLSINLWYLSIRPSYFWVFHPDMRTYSDIYRCSLYMKPSKYELFAFKDIQMNKPFCTSTEAGQKGNFYIC